MHYRRFQDDFGRALVAVKDSVNRDLGAEFATLQMETRNCWSLLVDLEAWWLEFVILSPRKFIVSEMLRNMNSGECSFRDSTSVACIVQDLRQALILLNKRMKAIPAIRGWA